MKKRVIVIADMHCGHVAGLTPPSYQYNEVEDSLLFSLNTSVLSLGYNLIRLEVADSSGRRQRSSRNAAPALGTVPNRRSRAFVLS
jgi:hypothetical protein